MICPQCGTRLSEGITQCHFCKFTIPIESTCQDIPHKSTIDERSIRDVNSQEFPDFINRFIALFTLLVLWISIILFGYEISNGVFTNQFIRAFVSILLATGVTFYYWLISPLLIRTLIDNLQPLNEKGLKYAQNKFPLLIGSYFIISGLGFGIFSNYPQWALAFFGVLSMAYILIFYYLVQRETLKNSDNENFRTK